MNVAFAPAADEFPPRRAFSVGDVRRMIDAGVLCEDERLELVEGDFVMMAAKGYAHEIVKNALVVGIARSLPDSMSMGVEMSVQFTDNTILEPDLVVFRKSALIESEANFCKIGPGGLLLAIEVAYSSLAYDRGLKARLHAGYGVQEFWVVDANERTTWIHTGPSSEGWPSIVERRPNETLATSALPNFSIRLGDIA
jgi:Uma2 family endonuclease